MIFTFKALQEVEENAKKLEHYDKQIQVSALIGDNNEEITRENLEEQPHFDKIEYLEGFKINKSLNNYLFMNGKVQITYEWETSEDISQTDIDKIEEIYANNPEDSHAIKTITDNKYSYEIDYGGYVKGWHERSANWELSSSKATIKSLQDGTIVICVLTDDYGWTFKNVDLDPGETVETNKEGSDCYILAGNECEVTVNSPDTVGEEFKYHFNQYDCKKLTSSKCFIKNISNEICRVVMICRS